MTIDSLITLLCYMTLFNLLAVSIWFVLAVYANQITYPLIAKWFSLPKAKYDQYNYLGIMLYKIGIYLFNIAPLIALYLVFK
jgi:hypothetical protein